MNHLFRLLLVWLLLLPAVGQGSDTAGSNADGVPADPAELVIANRSIFTFNATLLGETPAARVQRAKAVIEEALRGQIGRAHV